MTTRFLAPTALLFLALAACEGRATGSGQGSGGRLGGDTDSGGGAANSGGGASRSGGGEAGAGGASDHVPFAHVRAVTATGSDGAYTLFVSVESSDVDCSEFCNWWEVLGPDGELIYRRNLDHSHTDANGTSDADQPGNTFTRSGGLVAVTAAQEVLVRAHMSTGGYHGVVLRGTVAGGFLLATDVDDEFHPEVEFQPPLSDTCLF